MSAPPTDEATPKPSVLCVEDQPAVARLIERILAPFAERVVVVSSGDTAAAQLRAHPFDVLICDVGLPDVSGEDLARHALAEYPRLRGRVVLMSGMFGDDSLDVRYLQKPFTPSELLGVVEGLFADAD